MSKAFKFEGPGAMPPLASPLTHWYLPLSEKDNDHQFGVHDVITQEQYDAGSPDLKRKIDQLVNETKVLVVVEGEE
jgi:hypothetical protein